MRLWFFPLFTNLIIAISIQQSLTLTLSGSESSYAKFPPWNACPNASFTFEFKTRQNEALLWYVDDGGTYDFVQVMISGGQVRMVMNIVDGRDGNVEIILGSNLNDGNWHKVTLVRRRMEVTFTVDNMTESRYSFGSDFEFGHFGDPGIVWAGGLPPDTSMQLARLSLPSVALQPRLAGEFRNVIYGNCSCRMTRAVYEEAVGANTVPLEACDVRNPCREGCVCISKDDGKTDCDCSTLECVAGVVTHYELPMDRLIGTTLINPSGLDATAYGSPPLPHGIRGNSIELNGQDRYVRVSGPGHRHECFGDLTKCSHGYTLLFWSKFHSQQPTVFSSQTSSNEAERVFLSNGGHRDDGHGISGYFDSNKGQLKFVFKKKNGQQWRTTVPNVLPGSWHHVAATWNDKSGLSVYLDGELRESTTTSTMWKAGDSTNFNDFVIGRTNDAVPFRDQRRISIDEFHFWNQHFNATDIREQGPFYSIKLPMNSLDGSDIEGGKVRMRGSPRSVAGKMDQAIHLSGRTGNFIEVEGNQKTSCTGNLTLCKYGLTMAGWVQFGEIPGQNGASGRDVNILNSGGGIRVFLTSEGRLAAEARREDETWRAIDLDFIPQIDKWYYIEATWNENDGLDLYVDLKKLAASGKMATREQVRRVLESLMIGADSGGVPMTVDDVEIWYGDRKTLDEFKFIQRGRPAMHSIAMDSIQNNKVVHPYLSIDISGRAKIDQGKIGSGLALDGSNFASLGKQMESCLGNLDLCHHGMLMSAWMKPIRLDSGMDLLSTGSNGIKIRSIGNGKVKVSAKTTTHDWSLETDKIRTDQWQFIEVGWDPKSGLRLYKDEQLIASTAKPQNRVRTESDANPERDQFYIGRGDGSTTGSRYGQMVIDDVEYWHGNRDYLIAFNYIHRGKPDHIEIHMDAIEGNEVQHPDLTVSTANGPSVVPGKLNGAIRLDPARNQYIELVGDNYGNCAGNLERCLHGVTTSMFLNMRSMQNGAYYYSNGGGVRMFGRDKNLIVAADAEGKKEKSTDCDSA